MYLRIKFRVEYFNQDRLFIQIKTYTLNQYLPKYTHGIFVIFGNHVGVLIQEFFSCENIKDTKFVVVYFIVYLLSRS